MTPSEPKPPVRPGDSPLAFGVICSAIAVLCLLLGWAQGVRKDSTVLHIPETPSWLVVTAIFASLAIIFLLWSRAVRR